MFTIGQTSGVASRSAPEGEPIITIKNYLAKMAKCAEDLPSPHVAATKVVEVSQGSFSGGTVLKTSTSCAGSGCGGSGCGGGSSCSGSGGCGGKSCCGGGTTTTTKTSTTTSTATACAGGCCGGTGTSCQRGIVDQNGNTNPSNSTDISNGGGIAYSPTEVKGGITYTAPRTNVTPANGTITVEQPSTGDVQRHVGADGSITYTTTSPDGTITPVQGPIGDNIPYTTDAEVANVINYAAEHAIDTVQVANAGIQVYNDPIYEASKWLGVPESAGTKISPTTLVPSTINDILNSSYANQADGQIALAENFRATMCDRMPFPECAACQYAHNTIRMSQTDLYDLLYGIQSGLDAIVRGQCAWGNQVFQCPGMLRQMLEQQLGPIGAIVGMAAAGTMIATTAVHGALTTFGNLATAFIPTDLKIALLDSIGMAICAGGCPSSFSTLIGGILSDLDMPARTLFVSPAVNTPAITHDSPARTDVLTTGYTVSDEAKEKLTTVQGELDRINLQAEKVLDNPKAAELSGSTLPTSEQDVKIPTTDFRFQPGVTYYKQDGTDPVTGSPTYTPLNDSEVIPGLSTSPAIATYGKVYIDEKDSLAAVADPEKGMELLSTGVMGEVEIPIPLDMIPAIAKDGYLPLDFSEGSASVPKCSTNVPTDDIYVPTTDLVSSGSWVDPKTYYIYTPESSDPTTGDTIPGHYTELTHTPTQDDAPAYNYAGDTPTKTYYEHSVDPVTGEDTYTPYTWDSDNFDGAGTKDDPWEFKDDLDYYEDVGGKYLNSLGTTVYEKIERNTQPSQPTTNETSDTYANDLGLGLEAHKHLPTLGPVIFDNGMMVEPVVSTDSSAYTECIETPALVTDTGISVATMASLYKIGLSQDEIKLAYVLDHEENGSKMPYDCNAVRIPTILDTLPDDEYD